MQGQGTTLSRLNTSASPNAYVQQAGVLSIEDATATRRSQRTTTMDQTAAWETFEPGKLIDAGELAVEMEFDADGTAETTLYGDVENESNQSYRLTFPDNTTFDFSGFITEWGRATPQEERITRMVKFKLSGEPTLTAG